MNASWEKELFTAIKNDDRKLAEKAIEKAGTNLKQRVEYGDGCNIWGTLALFSEAKEGDTILHIAVRLRAFDVCRALIAANCDSYAFNRAHETPISIYHGLTNLDASTSSNSPFERIES